MTKLACYIHQWYVVFLLVLGYAILSNGAEFQGIKVIINGGALNPYLASLQVGDLFSLLVFMPLGLMIRTPLCTVTRTIPLASSAKQKMTKTDHCLPFLVRPTS
jgi:hypothetical protein